MIKISDTEYFSNDRTIHFLNMDCNVFMEECKENEFDLNLSDPPYGINENGGKQRTRKKHNNKVVHQKKDWDFQKPNKSSFDLIFKTSKNQIIWGANYFPEYLFSSMGWIFWEKQIGGDFSDGELAFTSFQRALKMHTKWSGGNDKIHPTQKPIELYCWILDNYTKHTDTILDCFGGSMSNAIACHMKRRKLTIIELDVDYFKSALSRFETYERQVEDIKEFGYAKTKLNSVNPTLF